MRKISIALTSLLIATASLASVANAQDNSAVDEYTENPGRPPGITRSAVAVRTVEAARLDKPRCHRRCSTNSTAQARMGGGGGARRANSSPGRSRWPDRRVVWRIEPWGIRRIIRWRLEFAADNAEGSGGIGSVVASVVGGDSGGGRHGRCSADHSRRDVLAAVLFLVVRHRGTGEPDSV